MINKEDLFRSNIVEELKILKNIDDNFLSKIRDISLEDLIYLKLFLAYSNLNKKFLIGLPVNEIIDTIVSSVIKRFVAHFNEEKK